MKEKCFEVKIRRKRVKRTIEEKRGKKKYFHMNGEVCLKWES